MSQPTYQNLAMIYDQLQQEIDLAAWADYVQVLETRYSRRDSPGDGQDGRPLLLDLGCGTGSFCLEMARRGYDPIGIDAAGAMLEQARLKAAAQPGPVSCLFLQQDISRFELYGTVDLMVCLLDTINHLLTPRQVRRLFALCANYLNPGGLLIFDVASRRHLAKTLGSSFFTRTRRNTRCSGRTAIASPAGSAGRSWFSSIASRMAAMRGKMKPSSRNTTVRTSSGPGSVAQAWRWPPAWAT